MVNKLTGLQREAIHLYRKAIRVSYTKSLESRPHFISYARNQFNKHRNISKNEFSIIEHLIRVGNKNIEIYARSELKDIH